MKVLVQRVKAAKCMVGGKVIGQINEGLCLFVSFKKGDTLSLIKPMVKKIKHLRIFEDDHNKMNLSLNDLGLSVLSISQFTLEASTQKGHRPSFTNALNPQDASDFYDYFNQALKDTNIPTETGEFQSEMQIELINDGPVTLMLERTNDND